MNEKENKLNKGSFLYINDGEKAEWGYPEGYPYKDEKGNIHPMAPDFLPQATQTTYGTVKQAAAVTNVTAAPTAEEFNALLKSLRDAGILATE